MARKDGHPVPEQFALESLLESELKALTRYAVGCMLTVDECLLYYRLPKLSQCTSLKTQSIFRRFGLMLRPSSGSVIQNSTKNDTW